MIKHIQKHDPVWRLLNRLSSGRSYRAYWLSFVAGTVIYFVYGAFVFRQTNGLSSDVLQIFDNREFFPALFGTIFNIPIIWVYYVRQPDMIQRMLKSLDLLSDSAHTASLTDLYSERSNSRANAILVVAVFAISMLATLPFILNDANPSLYGLEISWWRVFPLYVPLWIAFTYLPLYMIIWIILRHLNAVQIFHKQLQEGNPRPVPFHADEANGFGECGTYFAILIRYTVYLGSWMIVWSLNPVSNLSSDFLTQYGYIILGLSVYFAVPIFLMFVPIWKLHGYMKSMQDANLATTQQRLAHNVLKYTDTSTVGDISLMENTQALYKQLVLLKEGYKAWPFAQSRAFSIAFVYLLPVMGAVIPIIDLVN